jgi:hypothetical protein
LIRGRAERRALVEHEGPALPVSRQCRLLAVSRASVYRRPAAISEEDCTIIERLWRSLKYEEVYLKAYASVAEAKAGIGSWLGFYNEERQHQSLGYRTPRQAYGQRAPTPSFNSSASSKQTSQTPISRPPTSAPAATYAAHRRQKHAFLDHA